MKKRTTIRFLSMILALMLCLPMLFAGSNTAEAAEQEYGIFALRLENDSEYIVCGAVMIYDKTTEGVYLVADPMVASFMEDGYWGTLLAPGYSESVQLITKDGYFAYLYADGLGSYTPLVRATELYAKVTLVEQTTSNDGTVGAGLNTLEINLNDWVQDGGAFINTSVEMTYGLMGLPAVYDNLEIMGTMGIKDGRAAIYPITKFQFETAGAINNGGGSSGGGGDTGNDDNGGGGGGGTDDTGEDSNTTTMTIVIGVALVAVIVFFVTRKSKKRETTGAYGDGFGGGDFGGTISMDPIPGDGMMPPMDGVTKPVSEAVPPQWQIRGLEGPLQGRVFLLATTLRIGRSPDNDVVFPQNTAGISGRHCQLSFEHGRVVLRDLQSTYGTYMGNNVKLEPQISYNLQPGDTFRLAESGQTFRLEQAGASVQNLTPAVRNVNDGKVYRADMSGRISFGRDHRSQVPFDQGDSSVSTNHCVLYREGGALYLKDTNSTNGTFFAPDQRLKPNVPYKVRKGATFFLVSAKNTFVITEE